MAEEKQTGKLEVSYRCKTCDRPVEVIANPGKEPTILRSCEHAGDIVIAWISGTLVRVKSTMEG